jgi:psiF repeat
MIGSPATLPNLREIFMLHRALAALLAAAVVAIVSLSAPALTPALALTAKEKMETCKFGADDQKLQGAARKAFMAKCMGKEGPADRRPGKPQT